MIAQSLLSSRLILLFLEFYCIWIVKLYFCRRYLGRCFIIQFTETLLTLINSCTNVHFLLHNHKKRIEKNWNSLSIWSHDTTQRIFLLKYFSKRNSWKTVKKNHKETYLRNPCTAIKVPHFVPCNIVQFYLQGQGLLTVILTLSLTFLIFLQFVYLNSN